MATGRGSGCWRSTCGDRQSVSCVLWFQLALPTGTYLCTSSWHFQLEPTYV